MAQHDYDIANQSGANFRADLNNALDAIVSNNSGSSEPSTTFAYEWWVDTTNDLLKIRNSANNAWITLPLSITADNSTPGALTVNGRLTTTGIIDINGQELILDADADTSFTSDTDDQIDIKIGGADIYTLTASSFDFNGKELILDADADTSFTSDTDDQIDIKIGGTDVMQMTNSSSNFVFKNPVQDKKILFNGNDGGSEITCLELDMSTGNVVIRNQLTVRDAIVVNKSDGSDTVGFLFNSGNDFVVRNFQSSGVLIFNTGATERMRIDSSGSLLLGTTSQITTTSEEVLHIENGDSVGQIVLNNTRSSGSQFMVQIRRLDTLVGSIQTSTTATSYVTSSDYRLKENINYEFDGLSRVAQLKPARFNFIIEKDKTVDGFLAHEVSDIVPEAITGEKDGEEMQGIDQSKLVPLLTKAIQELEARVQALEE